MIEAIQEFFLETVGRAWCVLFCAMLPVIELRGAIPLGAALGLPMMETVLLSIVGNLLPVPLILLLIKWILTAMARSRVKLFSRMANRLFDKAERNRKKIERYAFWGLTLFVAIPLPGTGAWTGSLVAALFDMRFWRSLLSVTLGVLAAAVIMATLSYGTVAVFEWWG